MPQASTKRWTAETVLALPADGNRYEVVDGELLVTPAQSVRHQRAVQEMFMAMHGYAQRGGIGETFVAPADISTREDRLVQPDIFVVSQSLGRVRAWSEVTHLLLAVEILSPSTARADRQVKRRLYQEIADEYWIADLDARLIERWRPGDTRPEILTDRLTWRPGSAAAFELDLQKYFVEVGSE
ncbi:MAG: Uma2 family endonuclease [bacterium]